MLPSVATDPKFVRRQAETIIRESQELLRQTYKLLRQTRKRLRRAEKSPESERPSLAATRSVTGRGN